MSMEAETDKSIFDIQIPVLQIFWAFGVRVQIFDSHMCAMPQPIFLAKTNKADRVHISSTDGAVEWLSTNKKVGGSIHDACSLHA